MKAMLGRLGKLENRYRVRGRGSVSIRVLFVDPEEGLTEVLLIETDKPTVSVPPTPEEVEKVRVDLERRRTTRLSWNGGAN